MRRYILMTLGWLAMILATIGVILPLLPTTSFLLLAAWCFARSSPRFHDWLLHRSVFGRYLRYWQQHHAMPPGAKGKAILFILLTFALSLWMINIFWLRLLLLAILIPLIIFIIRLPVHDTGDE